MEKLTERERNRSIFFTLGIEAKIHEKISCYHI